MSVDITFSYITSATPVLKCKYDNKNEEHNLHSHKNAWTAIRIYESQERILFLMKKEDSYIF